MRGTTCGITFTSIFSIRLLTYKVLSFKYLNRNLNCQLNHSNSKGIDREVILRHLACCCQGIVVLCWVFSGDFANSFSVCQAGRPFLNWINSTSSVGKLLGWFPVPRYSMQRHSVCDKNRKALKKREACPKLWLIVHIMLPVPLDVAHYNSR